MKNCLFNLYYFSNVSGSRWRVLRALEKVHTSEEARGAVRKLTCALFAEQV